MEVTGLTDKRLDANQKDLWGTKARYQWQLFPNSYLLHIPIRIVRLVKKIDKQMKDTTVTFLDRKKNTTLMTLMYGYVDLEYKPFCQLLRCSKVTATETTAKTLAG